LVDGGHLAGQGFPGIGTVVEDLCHR
jgi:hypothetical protein